MNSSARFSFDDQGKRRFVGAPSGAMGMGQFMPDLPMASQRPVRTFADGGSVSNQQINDYIKGILSSGVSQQEAANQINAAAAQYGVSRDQIAGATGYGLDLVNQYLGTPAPVAAPSTAATAAPSTAATLSTPISAAPSSYFAAPTTSTAATTAPPTLQQNVQAWAAANPNATIEQIQQAASSVGYNYNPFTGTVSLGNQSVSYANAPKPTQPYLQSVVDSYFANTPGVTGLEAQRIASQIGLNYNPFTQTVSYGDLTYKAPTGAKATAADLAATVEGYFSGKPGATGEDAARAAEGIGGTYNPFTKTVTVNGLTYKTDKGPGGTQQQFQSLVDEYLSKSTSLTADKMKADAASVGMSYDPFTQTVTYGNMTYKAPKAPLASEREFNSLVDTYLSQNPNLTATQIMAQAPTAGMQYNPFTGTVTYGTFSYKPRAGANLATYDEFKSIINNTLTGGNNGEAWNGESFANKTKALGLDYDPFTKTIKYGNFNYATATAPGPTTGQFTAEVNSIIDRLPGVSGAQLYLAAKNRGIEYDPFARKMSFGEMSYSPQNASGYMDVPPDTVKVDQTLVNAYKDQLDSIRELAASNSALSPLANRAQEIYDKVFARLTGTKPPPPGVIVPPVLDDTRPVTPLPGITAPDANFRKSPPRVWNQLLGAFTYAPPASVSAPNPLQQPGAVAPGQGESWTPPVVTSRPRTLLNVRQNTINPRTGLPEYTAGLDPVTGIFTAPVSRSSQAASDRSRGFAGLNAAMAGKRYTTPEYYSFLANVRSGAYGNPTDPDFPSKVKAAVDAYYASKPAS